MRMIFKTFSAVAALAGVLMLAGCCDFEISTKTVPSGTVGQPYAFNLDTKCDDANWRLNTGQLPPGIALEQKGRLSGTPSLAGTYTFTLDAISKANPEGDVISLGYSLVVAPAP